MPRPHGPATPTLQPAPPEAHPGVSSLAAERREARALWPRLKDLERDAVVVALRDEETPPLFGLFARFLAASRLALDNDPASSRRFASVAAEITFAFEPWREPWLEPRDLLAAALAAEAEALRRLGAYERARLRLHAARVYQGTDADPRLIAEIDRIEAGVLLDLGAPEQAFDLYREAHERLVHASAPSARARIAALAATAIAALDPEDAYEAACEVVVFSVLGSRRRLARGAILVATAALEAEDLEQAEHALAQARAFLDRKGDPLAGLHLSWAQARIELARLARGLPVERPLAIGRRLDRTIRELERLGRERERTEAVLDRALASAVGGDLGAASRRLEGLAVRLESLGATSELLAALGAYLARLDAGGDRLDAVQRARLYLRRQWWRAELSDAASLWGGEPEPFGLDRFPICRAGIDAATREGRTRALRRGPAIGEESDTSSA